MSNQPRPWFRSLSIARPAAPAPAPTPAPEQPPPQPPQPRPVLRPAFRPIGQPQPPPPPPQQPQEPALPTSPPVAPAPRSPPLPSGVASLPASPIPRPPAPSASVPTSPARTSAIQPPVTTSVPSPPKPAVPSQPTISSVPSSPAQKQAPTSTPVPTSPAPKPAPYFSVPTSPAIKPVPTVSSVRTSPEFKPGNATTRAGSTAPSPRAVKPADRSPPRSPKFKPQAPPPSPLILPPPQIRADAEPEPKIPFVEAEKTVVVQKTTATAKTWSNGTEPRHEPRVLRKQGPFMVMGTKEKGQGRKISSDSDDAGVRVITIAGENKGATMEIFQSPKKNAFMGKAHTIRKKGSTERHEWSSSSSRSSSDEEKIHKVKDKIHNGMTNSPPMHAFMNSNVQGVNNSIVFKSECSHHDPGVHLSLNRKPGVPVKDRTNIGQDS